jgi:hypothetical protein
VSKTDLTEMLDLIVEMKDEPLFIKRYKTSGIVVEKSDYANRLMQFHSDIRALHQSAINSLKTTLALPIIKREFYKIFVGAAIRVPRAMVSQISSLNYVKKVHIDVQVKALLDHSVHKIHADSVWIKLGAQGDSVVVGIIDSGIDYSDTLLGGGFGPSYKVIGGYDFVNNDADPMDDYGHGTHVAGIVAANSVHLKGVAPHAKLMAFKVIDHNGEGTESTVLAGIEGATDPNDDGNSNDMVDVVNMSLGGVGSPDDPVSVAVDNAVSLGMTFCVAAGNLYNYYAISSPGTARSAITVGAVDEYDNIAMFSSKGPNTDILSIKPEVVAPGVNILSTVPGNNTERKSGTSMATPHVAGVCALLKSLHRNWSPAQIKSAIMTTALDLGQDIMAQGAGIIDALKAAEASAFVTPSHLSFGLDEPASIWIKTDTVWIFNRSDQSQSFSISFDGLRLGISITADPSMFSLDQNDSQQVIISLNVDNSQVPYPIEGSLAYGGYANINGTKDALHIPWAFVKAAKLRLAFDQPARLISFFLASSNYLINQNNAAWTDEYHAECIAPKDTYDLVTQFGIFSPTIVIRERLNIEGAVNLSISSAEAIHSVKLEGVDQNGQPLSSYQNNQYAMILAGPDSSRLTFMGFILDRSEILLSGFSNRFRLLCGESSFQQPNNIYGVNFDPVSGLHANTSLSNLPSEFRTLNLSAEFPPQSAYRGVNVLLWYKYDLPDEYIYSGFSTGSDATGFTGKWNGKIFFTGKKDSSFSFPISLVACDQPLSTFNYTPWFYSAPFEVVNDSIGMYLGSEPHSSLCLFPDDGSITLGRGPNYMYIDQYNSGSNIYVNPITISGSHCNGALDEYKITSIYRSSYSVYDKNNNVIASGPFSEINPINVTPDKYRLEIKHRDYYIGNMQGLATLTSRFDLRNGDPNPPQITSLSLFNQDGQVTDALNVGEHATLAFSTADCNGSYQSIQADSTKLFYRKSGTLAWNSLPINFWMIDNANANFFLSRGYVFKADMTPATEFDSTGIDIRIAVQDQSGNSTEWTLEPAFGINLIDGVEEEKSNKLLMPCMFALRQNYPNPFNPSTMIEFDIPRKSFVTVEVFNLLGQKVATILAGNLQAGTYKIPWNAGNLSSGIYFYRLNAESFTDAKKLLLLK